MYPEAEVVFAGQISREQLAVAPRLRWLHSPAAGVGGMLFPEMVAEPGRHHELAAACRRTRSPSTCWP